MSPTEPSQSLPSDDEPPNQDDAGATALVDNDDQLKVEPSAYDIIEKDHSSQIEGEEARPNLLDAQVAHDVLGL